MAGEKSLADLELRLREVMRDLLKNPMNSLSFQSSVTLYNKIPPKGSTTVIGSASNPPSPEENLSPVVTLYLGDQYAEFYNELTQIGHNVEDLKPLINYLETNGWKHNLD